MANRTRHSWDSSPYPGEVWVRKYKVQMAPGAKMVTRQETRIVVDRSLGNDVLFYSGRYKGFSQTVSMRLWEIWVKDAKRTRKGRSIVTNRIRTK